ncbi:MAG: hypothetical protein KDA86_15920 [Planctomycetaceae bacterium]|nr:hypothetical protein [Planctomycetaceae bacterium]
MSLDSLVHQIKNVSRLPDDAEGRELKTIAEELLWEYEARGEINTAATEMLLRLLRPEPPTDCGEEPRPPEL